MQKPSIPWLGTLSCFLWPAIALAGASPSAIVEDVQSAATPIVAFDYVSPSYVIELQRDGSLILDYLTSCVRERIEGGQVTVGETQSTVTGGEVKRLQVPCDGGAFQLTSAQAQQSAAVVFRGYDANRSKNLPPPQVTLYGTSPVVKLAHAGGTLEIRRIDQPEEPITVPMSAAAQDLAATSVSLTPGGLYQAQAQGRGITFKVDPSASSGKLPLVSRLLSF